MGELHFSNVQVCTTVNSVFLLFLPVRADVVGVERRSEKGLLVPVCKLLCDLGWY